MAISTREMERKIEELSLSIQRNESKLQQTGDRIQLMQLLRTSPPGTQRFNEIQNALLSDGMFFFVDPYTGTKYSLIKPEECLLGGAPQTINAILDGIPVRATLQDPIIPEYTLILVPKLTSIKKLTEKGKIYVVSDEKDKISYVGLDNLGKEIKGALKIPMTESLTQQWLDDNKEGILTALENADIIISRQFYRKVNVNVGWKEDWKILRPYVRKEYANFYKKGQDTLVNLDKLSKEDKNKLNNPASATIDRQNGSETHSNISYQVGKKKNRYTYGMTFVDLNAGIFQRTTGWHTARAIYNSVEDSYRYTVDVKIEFFDNGEWKICTDKARADRILEACAKKADEQINIEKGYVANLKNYISSIAEKYKISVLITIMEDSFKSVVKTLSQELEMPVETILLGIFCQSVEISGGNVTNACQTFETQLNTIKTSLPMTGEFILSEIDLQVLIKIIKNSIQIASKCIDEESPEQQETFEDTELLSQYERFTTNPRDNESSQPKKERQSSNLKQNVLSFSQL